MNFWNLLGLPSKKDYEALIAAVECLPAKNEQTVQNLSASLLPLLEQQAALQQKLLQEVSGLRQQLVRLEQRAQELPDTMRSGLAGMEVRQHDDIQMLTTRLERGEQSMEALFRESRQEFRQRFADTEAHSSQVSDLVKEAFDAIQTRMETDSSRCTENIETVATSISDSNADLARKLQDYYASISKGLRSYEKQQSAAQSEGLADVQAQIAQLVELMKYVWLNDLSDSLEHALHKSRR